MSYNLENAHFVYYIAYCHIITDTGHSMLMVVTTRQTLSPFVNNLAETETLLFNHLTPNYLLKINGSSIHDPWSTIT